MMSSFSNFAIERSLLAIPNASYNKGSKSTGGVFDLPTQVTIKLHNLDIAELMLFEPADHHLEIEHYTTSGMLYAFLKQMFNVSNEHS